MKIVNKLIGIFVLISILILNINIKDSYAQSIDLKSYTNRIIKDGKLNESYTANESKIASKKDYWYVFKKAGLFSSETAVHYEWLEAVDEMIKLINSSKVSYTDIAKNSASDIKNAIAALKRAQTNIGTFNYSDENVNSGQDLLSKLNNENRENVAQRSKTAFQNITKYNSTEDYNNYIGKAIRELNAAYDLVKGTSSYKTDDGDKIDINDSYMTKFKYTYKQIELYREKVYGYRYNCENADIIEKVWNYKVGVYAKNKGSTIVTRKDLFVSKNDRVEVKAKYDKDKTAIYYAAFGQTEGLKMTQQVAAYNNNKKTAQEIEKESKEIAEEVDNTIKTGDEYSQEHQNDFNEKYTNEKYDKEIADEVQEIRNDQDKDTIFSMPKNKTAVASNASSEFIEDADAFLNDENATNYLKTENLQSFSNSLYGNLLGVGIVIAIIVGAILGVKFMLASVAQKAEIKKLLVPYIVGCVVVFGAFGIWKLVVTILAGI